MLTTVLERMLQLILENDSKQLRLWFIEKAQRSCSSNPLQCERIFSFLMRAKSKQTDTGNNLSGNMLRLISELILNSDGSVLAACVLPICFRNVYELVAVGGLGKILSSCCSRACSSRGQSDIGA